jgi:hypothetical protein
MRDHLRGMSVRATVRLPEDLMLEARRVAAAEGTTLTSLIEEGLRLVVTENGDASEPARHRLATEHDRS